MSLPNIQRDLALEARLARSLGEVAIGRSIFAYQCVPSTMDLAHQLAAENVPHGTLVWAERQEHGRGRLGRAWDSPAGGLYCSFVLRPTKPLADTPQLSLVAGLAVAETIKEATPLFPSIRWPNDVLIGERKVAGILVEAKPGGVILGIGLNVTTNLQQLPEQATSLKASGAPDLDSYRMTATLCQHFHAWYDVWTIEGFPPIREALRPWIGVFGQPVHISAGASRFEGTASDLDEAGRLLVRLDSGIVQPFGVGEVTTLR